MVDNKRLFLDGIFDENSNSPSTITIDIPGYSGGSTLRGLIIGDPTWTASNKWGPIINDLSNLQDWASLVGLQNQFSWIAASTMCWKGTAPLGISVDFYLINYSSSAKKIEELKKGLSNFVKLASIYKSTDNSKFRVQVHGGYASDIFQNNTELFTNASTAQKMLKSKSEDKLLDIERQIFKGGSTAEGSVSIRFGHKSTISNLLVSKVNVTESTIEVANQDGSNPQPLYYRVSAQFTGVRPLITTDVDDMFNVKSTPANPNKGLVPFVVGQGHAGG